MMQLSIIIPVYNVEPYVKRCIMSLVEQDIPHEEYEIIVIIDGSPDNSLEIIISLQKEFSNIILIDQKNQGVSVARNNGIAVAKGKFILCVDPDDYIMTNSLARITKKAEKYNIDALYLGITIFDVNLNRKWHSHYNNAEDIEFNGVDAYFHAHAKNELDPDRSWAILYRRELLLNYQIKYPSNVPYLEDGFFLIKVFSTAKKCYFDSQEFYLRTTRIGSATKSNLSYSEEALIGFIHGANDLKYFINVHNFDDDQKKLINHGITRFMCFPITSCASENNYRKLKSVKKLLKQEGYGKFEIRGVRGVYRRFGKIYNLSAELLYFYFMFFVRIRAVKRRFE